MAKYMVGSEVYPVKDKVFYLHTPDGIDRSKLIADIEAFLKQPATASNLNTANKIATILDK
jgi:uncharacterized protein (DUF1697 family)